MIVDPATAGTTAAELGGLDTGICRSPLPVAGSKTSYPPVPGTSNRHAIMNHGPSGRMLTDSLTVYR
jgi:hypothetical protein